MAPLRCSALLLSYFSSSEFTFHCSWFYSVCLRTEYSSCPQFAQCSILPSPIRDNRMAKSTMLSSFSPLPIASASLRFGPKLAPGRTHHARLSTIIAKGCVNKALDVMYIVAFCIKDECHYVSESLLYSHALPSTYARTLSHTRSHINFALFFANGVGRRECAIFGSSYSTQLCVLQRR